MTVLTRRTFLVSGTAAAAVAAFIRDAGADDRLGPGARLTWYGQTASIPGTYNQLAPDANGEWLDERTGERYTEFPTPGAAAEGFVTLDLESTEGGEFVLWMTLLLAQGGRANAFIDANGLVGSRSVADYWVSPEELAKLVPRSFGSPRVIRGPYSAGGKTYDAVRIQSQSGGGWSQHTYDLRSGVCLASGTTVVGASPLIRDTGNTMGRGTGSTSISWLRIAGLRSTSLPGPGARFPDHVMNLRTVRYSGTRSVGAVGSSKLNLPIEATFAIRSARPTHLTAGLNLPGVGNLDRVVPPGVIGSLWMDPTKFMSHGRGARIDSDPLTGVEAYAVGDRGGMATFALQAGTARRTYGYDPRSGLLSHFDFRQRTGFADEETVMRLSQAN
jgi:hypothetical protein